MLTSKRVLHRTLAHLSGLQASSALPPPAADHLSDFSAPYQRTQQGEGLNAVLLADDPASPIHRADSHATVTVASLVLPNVRGNKPKALARVELYMRRAAARGAEIMVIAASLCIGGTIMCLAE